MLDTFMTARLRAERLREEHLDEVRRMHTDPVVMAELGGVKTEAESRDYLTKNLDHWETHGYGLWIVYSLTGVEPIGRAVVRRLALGTQQSQNRQGEGVAGDDVEVGYAFYESWWGQGLATELTLALLGIGFRELKCDSLVAVTSAGNVASQHVLNKCGLAQQQEVELGGSPMLLFRITQ